VSNLYRGTSCTPTAAFRLLADQARLGVEFLRSVRFVIESKPEHLLEYVTVWARVSPDSQDAPDKVPFLEPEAKLPQSALDFERGLACLLLSMRGQRSNGAEPNGESLFLMSNPELKPLADLLRRLEYYALPPRVACVQTVSGNHLCLLHIWDDVRRGSGVFGLRQSGAFEGLEELKGYSHQRLRVFVPPTVALEADSLRSLGELCAREAFVEAARLTEQGPDGALFYVIRNAADSGISFETLHLPRSAFINSAEVRAPAAAEVKIVQSVSALQPADLGALLREREPEFGYRLRLRDSRVPQRADVERERLRLRKAEVDQRLAQLETIGKPRPYLLRFNQRQLRALAHTAHSFPVDAVSAPDGRIRYAFQATAREPGGFHYLLVQPDLARKELDPLPLYNGDSPIKFCLDPTWARNYLEEKNKCYIFVPEHTALSPSLHSWKPDGMDEYMREVLRKRWPHQPDFPADPYYIFDRDLPDDDAIQLSVLNAQDFKPLQLRLQWINDNLTLARSIPIEGPVSEAAMAERVKNLAEANQRSAAGAVAAFRRQADNAVKIYAQDLGRLVTQVQDETDAALSRVSAVADGFRAVSEQLKHLVDVQSRKAASIKDLDVLLKTVDRAAQQFQDELAKIASQKIGPGFDACRALIDQQNRKHAELITELDNNRKELERKLSTL
jgi:hypothetical protein